MPPEAVALVLLAAVLHAVWNAVIKRSGEPRVLFFGMQLVGGLVTIPWLVAAWDRLSPEVFACAVPSALLELVYSLLLAAAYARYDLSLVYPVARGSAPVWLAAIAALALGERPSLIAWAGIAAIVAGILLATVKSARDPFRALREPSVGISLLVGLSIAAYSAVDKVGVRSMPPLGYVSLVFLLTAVALVPFVLPGRGARGLVGALAASWRPAALVGTFSVATYGIVLIAFSLSPVSYAGALREISVVVAAFIGWWRLREPVGIPRLAAACLVAVGAVLVARG